MKEKAVINIKLEEAKKLIAEQEQKEVDQVVMEFNSYVQSLRERGFNVSISQPTLQITKIK